MTRPATWLSMLAIAALPLSLGCTTTADDDFGGGDDDDEPVDCTDYRTTYPTEGLGTFVGATLADFPGMVDRDDAPQSLEPFFLDHSLLVLVIVNAFDT